MSAKGWDFKKGEWNKRNILIGLVVAIIGVLFMIYQFNHELHDNGNVSASTIEKAIKDDEVVVFYSDECSHCREIFWKFYLRKTVKKDVLLVNLASPDNHDLIKKYSIKVTPTFMDKNGTNTNIEQFDWK